MAKLTDKQQRFVDEYLIDLNATQAAIRAGYSVNNADEIGSELLGKTRVLEAVSKAMAERSKRTGVTVDRIVLELAKIAFIKMTDVVDSKGRIKETATDDDLSCIEYIRYKQLDSDTSSLEEREVKIASKVKALELLGKHLGMWNDKLNVSVTLPVVISGDDQLED
ncbi:terminase [Anaerocolumna cellulosilytica]|uniref:Terminase n=1 Tax=Anaerocolumna cellulosilytica TaxID=433286 RepID=A0A6S6QZN8_9FIRM|nr:terminase small subunit [Anaerocolumna cellulosilytica]MBB5197392.1 phage terminase small subunit [Anaerocolumna cellulosilytica]BCJ92835.1 terminase [Anaerocolumna cellulosilytica]